MIADWIEQHLRLPSGPLRLSPIQRAFVEAATETDEAGAWVKRLCVASWPRRSGKTLCVAARACYALLTQPASRSIIAGPSQRHGEDVLGDMVRTLARHSTKGLVIGAERIYNPEIDAEIIILPSREESVAGIGPSHGGVLCLDETWAADAEPTGPMATAGGPVLTLLAATEDVSCQTWVSSILGPPTGLTAHWYAHRNDWPHLCFSYEQDAIAVNPGRVTPEWIAAQERELYPSLFRLFHRNECSTAAEALVAHELIDACVERGRRLSCPVTGPQWEALQGVWNTSWVRTIGLDRALARESHHDRTVGVLLARPTRGGPCYVLDVVIFRQGHSQTEILDCFDGWRRYGSIWRSGFEQYGAGDLEEAARRYNPHLIAPTGPRQTGAWNALASTIRDGNLVIAAQGEGAHYLVKELKSLRVTVTTQGLLHAEARPHDDSCFALLWALDVMLEHHVSPYREAPTQETVEKALTEPPRQCAPAIDRLMNRLADRGRRRGLTDAGPEIIYHRRRER